MKKILFVDDEENILKSYKRLFIDSGYDLSFALNGEEAITKIRNNNFDLVITDMRMPGINGYDLLKRIQNISPNTTRIVMSGFSEKEDTLRIIYDGTAKAYLVKPWNNDELKNTVSDILSATSDLQKSEFLSIIEDTMQLPVLPEVYQSILNLIKIDASIDKISKYVEQVPDYSARLLRIINSAFYGISTGSVKKAIVYLGLDTVKNIVLTSEIFDAFKDAKGMEHEWQNLWDHSIMCSKLFHGLYQKILKRKVPEEYGASGLLHDIGDLLIIKHYPQKYKDILNKRKTLSNTEYIELEKEILGESHGKIGGFLLAWWNLPQSLIDSCTYHHGPFPNGKNKELVMILHAADALSHKYAHDSKFKNISEEVLEFYKMRNRDFILIADAVIHEDKISRR